MVRRPGTRRARVTAAAVLPATMLVASFVAAPFAGTTTAPLAAGTSVHARAHPPAGAAHAAHSAHVALAGSPAGMHALVVGYLLLAVVAVVVLLAVARAAFRRHR